MSNVVAAEPGEISLTAPMPGIIIACKLSEGEPIKAGDIVVVLEAMKMENDPASPADGTVKKNNLHTGRFGEKG
jgi:biotin carboxyl carrier protein